MLRLHAHRKWEMGIEDDGQVGMVPMHVDGWIWNLNEGFR